MPSAITIALCICKYRWYSEHNSPESESQTHISAVRIYTKATTTEKAKEYYRIPPAARGAFALTYAISKSGGIIFVGCILFLYSHVVT